MPERPEVVEKESVVTWKAIFVASLGTVGVIILILNLLNTGFQGQIDRKVDKEVFNITIQNFQTTLSEHGNRERETLNLMQSLRDDTLGLKKSMEELLRAHKRELNFETKGK